MDTMRRLMMTLTALGLFGIFLGCRSASVGVCDCDDWTHCHGCNGHAGGITHHGAATAPGTAPVVGGAVMPSGTPNLTKPEPLKVIPKEDPKNDEPPAE